jgi:histidinol-phosphate aminotransferase
VAALEAAGITVAPSAANFVLARFIDSAAADAAETFLRERAILVRRMGAYGLPESLRITIGLEHEIAAVAGALGDFMKGNGHGG